MVILAFILSIINGTLGTKIKKIKINNWNKNIIQFEVELYWIWFLIVTLPLLNYAVDHA